jgi:hypothetical protein
MNSEIPAPCARHLGGLVNQRVCVCVPFWNLMATRIIFGEGSVSSHHSYELRATCLLEARTASDLGDVTAAYYSPAD